MPSRIGMFFQIGKRKKKRKEFFQGVLLKDSYASLPFLLAHLTSCPGRGSRGGDAWETLGCDVFELIVLEMLFLIGGVEFE